jgi:ribosomal protein S18 acetylase RimI-like enzyme
MSPRRLVAADAPAYRALMLQAYAQHPDAFTSTLTERATLPLDWWAGRFGEGDSPDSLVMGAFAGESLVGAAGLSVEPRERLRHKATLYGMVVSAGHRRAGHGIALVHALLENARGRPALRVVQLTVTQGNAAAQALYERCGFTCFGVEPLAVALGDGFVTKVHLSIDLRS